MHQGTLFPELDMKSDERRRTENCFSFESTEDATFKTQSILPSVQPQSRKIRVQEDKEGSSSSRTNNIRNEKILAEMMVTRLAEIEIAIVVIVLPRPALGQSGPRTR